MKSESLALSPQSPVVCKPGCGAVSTDDALSMGWGDYFATGQSGSHAYCTQTCLAAAAPQGVPPACPHGNRYEDCCWAGRAPARSPQVEPPELARCALERGYAHIKDPASHRCIDRDAAPATPIESVRPARAAREVAHELLEALSIPCTADLQDDDRHDDDCHVVVDLIERDRRGRTGDEP